LYRLKLVVPDTISTPIDTPMSIKLKVRLFKGKTHADGTHPIQLQFYLNGKEKRKGIYFCKAKDWDEKECRVKSKVSNSAYINNLISEKYSEFERELIKVMNGDAKAKEFFEEKKVLTLGHVFDVELSRLKREIKPAPFKRYEGYQRQLSVYTDIHNLDIKDIDLNWYQSAAVYFKQESVVDGKVVKKANMGSTIQKKIKAIRRLIERYSGELQSDEIRNFRVPTKKTVKQKLTASELLKIEALELKPDSNMAVARDIFLMQLYLRGARVGSILQAYPWQFDNGRYTAVNTDGKNNVGSRLIPKAQAIVDHYYGRHERLFPFYKFKANPAASDFENKRVMLKKKEASTAMVNKLLKDIAQKVEIDKPLSTHIARHTFARMAIDKINNPMVTMELLGHSSLAVHQQYLNDIRKDDVLDAAADDIFS
jgi:integrase/recombinase XerD